jgi:hypothetical protein
MACCSRNEIAAATQPAAIREVQRGISTPPSTGV